VKNSMSKRCYTFYSTQLFCTAGSSWALWLHMCPKNCQPLAWLDFCQSRLSPLSYLLGNRRYLRFITNKLSGLSIPRKINISRFLIPIFKTMVFFFRKLWDQQKLLSLGPFQNTMHFSDGVESNPTFAPSTFSTSPAWRCQLLASLCKTSVQKNPGSNPCKSPQMSGTNGVETFRRRLPKLSPQI